MNDVNPLEVTEDRPRFPRPPAPARHLPVQQPDIRYAKGVMVPPQMALTSMPPSGSIPAATALFHSAPTTVTAAVSAPPRPHAVDVRRPRHAAEDVAPPSSWWRRERTHVLAGMVGGGLVVFFAALAFMVGAVLS